MFKKLSAASIVATVSQAASGSFKYDLNGADWDKVEALCGTGKEQSPINLYKWMTDQHPDQRIEGFNYMNYGADAGLTINKTTDTMTMAFTDGRLNLTMPLKTSDTKPLSATTSNFYPVQLHFHAPSEHTVNGMFYDLEMHIVHTYKDGSLGAVLGIFFDVEKGGWGLTEATRKPDDWAEASVGNKSNEFIESLMFGEATEEGTALGEVALGKFLSEVDMRKFWSYDGSLTTPPCTEGIKWHVVEEV